MTGAKKPKSNRPRASRPKTGTKKTTDASESELGAGRRRLHVVLAHAGIASRREAERMILAGDVRVNGCLVRTLGTTVDPTVDHIKVRGRLLRAARSHEYLAFHKPVGLVTSMRDPKGRPCLGDLFGDLGVRVYPIGRLDYNSSGLLLLTNDGATCQRLTHPRYHVEKTYRVKLSAVPSDGVVKALRRGVVLDDGPTAPAFVRAEKTAGGKAWLEVRLREGRNRQLRRMLEAVGLRVEKLRRTAVGPIRLGRLPAGAWRRLSSEEVATLRAAAGLD